MRVRMLPVTFLPQLCCCLSQKFVNLRLAFRATHEVDVGGRREYSIFKFQSFFSRLSDDEEQLWQNKSSTRNRFHENELTHMFFFLVRRRRSHSPSQRKLFDEISAKKMFFFPLSSLFDVLSNFGNLLVFRKCV